jgi:hypothetical protein
MAMALLPDFDVLHWVTCHMAGSQLRSANAGSAIARQIPLSASKPIGQGQARASRTNSSIMFWTNRQRHSKGEWLEVLGRTAVGNDLEGTLEAGITHRDALQWMN